MAKNPEGSREAGSDQGSRRTAMLSSPTAGGMRLAGNYAGRGSPGVVRRTASRPISIIRSSSVPTQLQDSSRSQQSTTAGGGGSGGKAQSRRGPHMRDWSLQHDCNSVAAGGRGGVAQSLPIPQAPMLAGSLPPSRFLEDLPPLSLGPQASVESFTRDCGALSTSLKTNRLYATSCPATIGGRFGRPPEAKVNMSVLEEGTIEEEQNEGDAREPKSFTALSIMESLAGQAPDESPTEELEAARGADAESVDSSGDSSGERLPIQEDVFELEGVDGVGEELEALSLAERRSSKVE